MRRVRQHLSYSNVMATIAVFVAIGGGAYAASKIGADDIKRNAVRSKHIKNGQVKKRDLGKSSLDALRGSCPSGMKLVGAARDLCVDRTDRATNQTWYSASDTCANAGLRLPSIAEAFEAKSVLDAGQIGYWTDHIWQDNNGTSISTRGWYYVPNGGLSVTITADVSRVRCVATPSDA